MDYKHPVTATPSKSGLLGTVQLDSLAAATSIRNTQKQVFPLHLIFKCVYLTNYNIGENSSPPGLFSHHFPPLYLAQILLNVCQTRKVW